MRMTDGVYKSSFLEPRLPQDRSSSTSLTRCEFWCNVRGYSRPHTTAEPRWCLPNGPVCCSSDPAMPWRWPRRSCVVVVVVVVFFFFFFFFFFLSVKMFHFRCFQHADACSSSWSSKKATSCLGTLSSGWGESPLRKTVPWYSPL